MAPVTVTARSKSVKTVEAETSASVQEIVAHVAAASRLNANRIRLTYKDEHGKQVPLEAGKQVGDYFGAGKPVHLYAKDLGPQLAWRTVFLLEYLGPVIIHLAVYAYFATVRKVPQNATQNVAVTLAVLHFAKREYETVYVHRFSNATMPLFNLFKNSGHYWLLSGVLLSVFVYARDTARSAGVVGSAVFFVNDWPAPVLAGLVAVWAFAEASNFATHKTLSLLRDKDPKAYVIPRGYGFSLVSCPNYFFESLSWLVFAVLVGNWSAWLFLVVSSGQMYIWAVKKHRRYLKTFGDEYKKLRRTPMFPFV